MMRFLVSGMEFGDLLSEKVGKGKCILFKYGPGTGGDILLKQYLADEVEGTHSVFFSTHESESELLESVREMGLSSGLEIISLLGDLNQDLDRLARKDRFRTDGIMVTDLLEMSSNTSFKRRRYNGGKKVLARITSLVSNQVLPFRLIVDSIADLVRKTSPVEVENRIHILKENLKERGGIVIFASPIGWDCFKDMETTLFDALIDLKADNSSGTWKRSMEVRNLKGSSMTPTEWEVTTVRNIQKAMSID
jgi:KaiC/GvpD/RAD55 family RecA-like ATPase